MNKALTVVLTVCVGLCVVVFSSNVFGADQKESGNSALQQELDRQKWYSAEKGAPKFLPQEPPMELKRQTPNFSFPSRSFHLESVGEWLALCALCVFVILIVLLLVYAYRRREKRLKFEIDEITKRKRRVESLAEEARDSYDDLKGAYQRAAKNGDYRSAVIFFFSWILVECDKAELILLDKGKTNLEYWREFESSDPEREIYVNAMRVFERVYFGDESIDRVEFNELESQASGFEKLLAKRAEAREQERLAQEAAKNQLDSLRWRQGSKVARIVFVVAALALLGGCRSRKPDYWKPTYEMQFNDDSINGESAFMRYCGARFDKRVSLRYSYSLEQNDCDVLVWFVDNNVFFGTDSRFLLVQAPKDGDEKSIKRYDRCLERYANCDPEKDWSQFVVPASNGKLYRSQYNFAYDGVQIDEVESWLSRKPNRVFVCFFSLYDSSHSYWEAAKKDVETEPASVSREEHLRQCRDALENYALNNRTRFRSPWIDALEKRRAAAIELLKMKEMEDIFDDQSQDGEYLRGYKDPDSAHDSLEYFTDGDFSSNGIDLGDDWDDETDVDESEATSSERSRFSHNDIWCRSVYRDYDPDNLESVEYARFSGDSSWTTGLPDRFPLLEGCSLVPNEALGAKTLLALGDVPLVVEKKVGQGKILFVNSTSFINNFGLTDPTNRALATRLADEMAPQNNGEIVFLEGVLTHTVGRVREFSDKQEVGKFSLTKATPFTYFAWHVIALTVVFFTICWPIFGRPKRLVRERATDFSRHIAAYGDWLKSSNAVQWTREKIDSLNEQYGYNVEDVDLLAQKDATRERDKGKDT